MIEMIIEVMRHLSYSADKKPT